MLRHIKNIRPKTTHKNLAGCNILHEESHDLFCSGYFIYYLSITNLTM
jgi:hypothetical protein